MSNFQDLPRKGQAKKIIPNPQSTFFDKPKVQLFKKNFRHYINMHFVALKLGFNNVAKAPFTTFMTLFAIGIALSIPLGLHAFLKNIQGLASNFEYRGTITLYLDKGISHPQVLELSKLVVATQSGIESTSYISQENALKEFRSQADVDDILKLLPYNPLHPMLIVKLDTQQTTAVKAQQISNALKTLPGVTSADLDYEWVEKLRAFINLGKTLANSLGLLIGLGIIFIIGNTIRLALAQHKEELEVLNLIGATQSFIRRPFLYRGIFYGGLGALIASVIISIATWFLQRPVMDLASLYNGMFAIHPLTSSEIFSIFIYSSFLGGIGACVAFYQQQKAVS